jgi:isoleucyl-tRNA synthetase
MFVVVNLMLLSSALALRLHFPHRIPLKHKLHNVNFNKYAENKYFEFQTIEKEIYTWWESSGYFKPAPDNNKKPFVLPMPPPNVTGYLHMGHAMFGKCVCL